MWERKATPASLTVLNSARDITWNPPESVRMGPDQFMKRCRPPRRFTRSAPGRNIR